MNNRPKPMEEAVLIWEMPTKNKERLDQDPEKYPQAREAVMEYLMCIAEPLSFIPNPSTMEDVVPFYRLNLKHGRDVPHVTQEAFLHERGIGLILNSKFEHLKDKELGLMPTSIVIYSFKEDPKSLAETVEKEVRSLIKNI